MALSLGRRVRLSQDGRRRIRRMVEDRLYCSTNGCTTHLVFDPATGVATCPVCGFQRRIATPSA